MCACHAGSPHLRPVAGEACGDLFLALQHQRLYISHGSHDHVLNGDAISLTLSGT